MISLIAATGLNNELGKDNSLLWNLPKDMKHFKDLTTNNFVLYGRKTFESLGCKPLPNRTNILLTRDENYQAPFDIYTYSNIQDVLNDYYDHGEGKSHLFICGGENVYKQWLEYADNAYVTIILSSFEADTHFPKFPEAWEIAKFEVHEADDKNEYGMVFTEWKNKNKLNNKN